jgi:hypothetical protein
MKHNGNRHMQPSGDFHEHSVAGPSLMVKRRIDHHSVILSKQQFHEEFDIVEGEPPKAAPSFTPFAHYIVFYILLQERTQPYVMIGYAPVDMTVIREI